MKQAVINKKRYKVPESWNELSSAQKRQATSIVNHKMDHYDMRMQLIIVLLKIVPRRLRHIRVEQMLTFMDSSLFVLDHFKIGLHGPGDSMELATFGEFRRWEKWVNLFQASDDKKYKAHCLDNILSIIYRPIRDGFDPEIHQDKREPYHDWKVEKYLQAMADYPPEEKEIFAEIFFTGRNELMNLFPHLFKRTAKKEPTEKEVKEKIKATTDNADTDSQPIPDIPGEPIKTGKSRPMVQKNEWIQVLRKVSLTPADFQKIDNLPVTDVLFDLNERIREMEELNAKKQKV